jgi:hypothetical protein
MKVKKENGKNNCILCKAILGASILIFVVTVVYYLTQI